MTPLKTLIAIVASAVLLTGPARAADFNYAEALQKSLYFYEAQQSGRLSPNNRVAWRGDSCLEDGRDIGRDLSGGWFDAGDHWTANLTMGFAAMTLAWSAVESPEAWRRSGQMEVLLESLVHVNGYFLRCVLNPECRNPALDLEVAIGCGGREGVETPNVHAMWGPAETAHLLTKRPTFLLNRKVPGGDIPAAMAAAMAAGAMVIRDHGDALRKRPGFHGFQPAEFASRLLDHAAKLTEFAQANAGPVLKPGLPEAEKAEIAKRRRLALRSDGKVVETGYRADPFDKIVAAASWLARAEAKGTRGSEGRWLGIALGVYTNEYQLEENRDWWKDYGAGNFGKLAAYNLMRLLPEDPRFHEELQLYCTRFCSYRSTPGGLRLREWHAHEYGSLRHANNAATIALHYSDHVGNAPTIPGNTWWKEGRSNAALRDLYRSIGRKQVDYALGENPYGRSYLVGFGRNPFDHVHHRGAYGAWAGFDHFIPGKADDRGTNRHVLFGALVAGPDHNDVFLCGPTKRLWGPVPAGGDGFLYRFPGREKSVPKDGYQWSPDDAPVQDVMDSQFNEVALDYNAGITASFAWLVGHGLGKGEPLPESGFPPRPVRVLGDDLRSTDRELFLSGRRGPTAAEGETWDLRLHNRTRWPAKVLDQVTVELPLSGLRPPSDTDPVVEWDAKKDLKAVVQVDRKTTPHKVRISFGGLLLHPGNAESSSFRFRLRWPDTTGVSVAGPGLPTGTEEALIPEAAITAEEQRSARRQPRGEMP
jgi:hypothetical protein